MIGDYQIGFKKGSRTADHVFLLKGIIYKYVQKGKKMFACFVDYKKIISKMYGKMVYITN